MDCDARCSRVLFCNSHRLLGRSEAGGIPALLRGEDCVAALSHSEIERLSRLAAGNRADQQCIRLFGKGGMIAPESLTPEWPHSIRAMIAAPPDHLHPADDFG